MDRLSRRFLRRDGVQRAEGDGEKFFIQRPLGRHGALVFGGGVLSIQRHQRIGKAPLMAAAIDENLRPRIPRDMHRHIHRQTRLGEKLGAVIFARHLVLAFLLMEFEEELLAVGREETVERVQAVLVVIDPHVARLQARTDPPAKRQCQPVLPPSAPVQPRRVALLYGFQMLARYPPST